MPYATKEKYKEYQREYRKQHREKAKATSREYYINNKDEIKKKAAIYYKQNLLQKKLDRIKFRCYNEKSSDYKYYGARGIECHLTVDDLEKLWKRDNAESMKRPSIDRKDSSRNYEFENCRFIEHEDNCRKAMKKRWK